MDDDLDESPVTINSAVRDKLYNDIMTGRLPAGKRLTINELSKRYDTSTTPVRAALLELQGKGLVTLQPNRGATVRLINKDYLQNIHDVRTAIIRLLVPKCVMYVNNADIAQARELEATFKAVAATGDVAAVLEARSRFYRFVFRLARNPEAVEVIDRAWSVIDLLRLRYGLDAARLKLSAASHEELIDALSRRDADAALMAVLSSNDRAVRDLLECMHKSKLPAL